MKESPSNNNEHQDPAISPSPIKTSTFLDNLPLSVSVDSDPIVPLTPDLKPVASDPDPISKLQKTDSSSSKDSFDFVPLTQDSPKKPQKSKPLQSKSSKSNLLQISKEDAKQVGYIVSDCMKKAAEKYLNSNQRVIINYIPEKK